MLPASGSDWWGDDRIEQGRKPAPINADLSVAGFQRLVANPALVALAGLIAFLAIRQGVSDHRLAWFLMGVVVLVVSWAFGQYHCLDCGATGWALRASRHACPAVVARASAPGPLGRFPRLGAQFKIWIALGATALLLYGVAIAPRALSKWAGVPGRRGEPPRRERVWKNQGPARSSIVEGAPKHVSPLQVTAAASGSEPSLQPRGATEQ